MSKVNKPFGTRVEEQIKTLKTDADVHGETHHISYKLDTLPGKVTVDSIKEHLEFFNQTSLAVGAATSEIAAEQYPETKQVNWTGRLELCEGLIFNTDVHLKETVDGKDTFGITQTYVDHPHSQEMIEWYSTFQDTNQARAQALFK